MTEGRQPRQRAQRWLVAGLALLCSLAALRGSLLQVIPESTAREVRTQAEFVAAAAEAQAEGQWLLRELPRVARVEDPVYIRYPLFQFYAVLPYALGGAFVHLGLSSYHALLGVVLLSFMAGFIGMHGLARALGLSWGAAIAAAVVFSLAPYHLSDWYGRFAFPELAAFGVLPLAFWGAWAAWDEPGLPPLLWSCLAWMGLILSHNIFHLFGLLFVAASLALRAHEGGRWRLLWRPALAYALALLCCAWFLAPVALLGPHLIIANFLAPPFSFASYSPLSIMLSPWLACTAEVQQSSPRLGLQLGWLILLAAGLSAWPSSQRSGQRQELLLLFLLALILAWSPVDLWSHLGPLKVAQFPYRLLVFTTLYGALLVGEAWDRSLARLGDSRWQAAALLGLFGVAWLFSSSYTVMRATQWPVEAADAFYQQAGANLRTGYLYQFPAAGQDPLALATEDLSGGRGALKGIQSWEGMMYDPAKVQGVKLSVRQGPLTEASFALVKAEAVVLLPAPWYPWLYRVMVDGRPHPYLRSGNRLALRIPAGTKTLSYRFCGLAWANGLSELALLFFLGASLACLLRACFD